ncbi:hypothetical protein [Jiella pelagia]|uniref:Uncharacterized protein n=1 Tax=Jiella pelagia TaxID=2986949 RepID=A0ABY7C1S0_9HYPH|nr:hypothetical protein [Jiella pelagia]WAP69602.1 hypothetical protein OH818_05055 [Jiella pelagia]
MAKTSRRPLVAVAAFLALAAIVFFGHRPAAAYDDPAWWNGEIDKAEAEAQRLWDVMAAKGTFAVGTSLNEVDVEIHTCHILSIFLDKPHLTPLLVARFEPEPDADPGFDEGAEGNSRSNWANLARDFLAESQVERIRAWNLDCVGKFGITGRDSIREQDRRALVEIDGEVIRVLGDVEAGFSSELQAAIDANPAVKRVALGSAGGNVGEAVRAGQTIREKKLDTELYNNCESACSLVFLGGVERGIWSPYPTLGFHRISAGGAAIPDDSDVYDRVREYADDLGADGKAVVGFMLGADVREMYRPEMDDLCAAAVATAVQRVCFGTPRNSGRGETLDEAPAVPDETLPREGSIAAADDNSVATATADAGNDAAPGGGGAAESDGRCADIRTQRARIAANDPKIAADPAELLTIYDAMLRDYGC